MNFTTSFQRLRCPEVVCVCVCVYALVYVFCMYLYACGKYGVSSRSSRARASYTVLTLSSVKFVSIFHDHSDSNLPRPVSLCPRGLGFHLGVRPIPRAFDDSSPSSRSPPPLRPHLARSPYRPLRAPLSPLSIPSFSTVQRIPFLPLSRCLEFTDYTPRSEENPVVGFSNR